MPTFTPLALVVVLSLGFANTGEKSPACSGEGSPQVQTLIWLVRRENHGGSPAHMISPVQGLSANRQLRSLYRPGRGDSMAQQVSFTHSDGSGFFRYSRQLCFTTSEAFIEYLHHNLPSAPLPLGNTQIRLKVPITEE